MNANWFQTSGVNKPRFAPHLRNNPEGRTRVVVLGSFMGGFHVLSELVFGELASRVQVVGIATDDPTQSYTNGKVRLWRHPHTHDDETLVRRFAAALSIPVFTGRVKSPEFHDLMTRHWRPELCLMATFGQKIPKHIIEIPKLGFFNFHHSANSWPSYPGPDPIGDMLRDGLSHLVLTLHRVNETIDGGEFFARSHQVALPPGVNAIDLPGEGPLLPYLAQVRAGDRATEFGQRCRQLGIRGVTLHSYRYTWAERAKVAGYPERFAQEALGHNSRAVHQAYAKRALMKIPSLQEYEERSTSKTQEVH